LTQITSSGSSSNLDSFLQRFIRPLDRMKHDLKFLVNQNIPQQTTNAFLDEVRRNENNGSPIQDPDVIAMRKNYAELRRQSREAPEETDKSEGRRGDKAAMSDGERERISIWIQTMGDDDEEKDAKDAEKTKVETNEEKKFR
jgi:hypothetical protein